MSAHTRPFNQFAIACQMLICAFGMLAGSAIAHDKTTPAPNVTQVANPAAQPAIAVVTQLRDAIKRGDTKLASQVLAENATIFEQGHAEKSRAEYLSHHFIEDAAFAKEVPTIVISTEVTVDGNVAIVTAIANSEGQFKGKAVKNTSVETYVLRFSERAWRIEHIHWSSRKRS
jgi:ketosteroid isomerase-like protein